MSKELTLQRRIRLCEEVGKTLDVIRADLSAETHRSIREIVDDMEQARVEPQVVGFAIGLRYAIVLDGPMTVWWSLIEEAGES